MSVVILNILCEGQTEERFVGKVLKPYLKDKGIVVKSRLLVTSRKKNAQGGILSYAQVIRDLQTWMKEAKDNSHEKNFFTTMFDWYRLPNDFPAWDEAKRQSDCYNSIERLEAAFGQNVNKENFVPYIQLHEFEALVFCGLDSLKEAYPGCDKEIEGLKKVLADNGNNPEKINNSLETAPSKRLKKALSKRYNYDKIKSGTEITEETGIDALRKSCPHFNEWLGKIERLSVSINQK